MTTKEKILFESLNLFSEKGYRSVTVAEIANAVGIKAPSLYKHYSSKQAIFNAILEEMAHDYEQQASQMNMNGFHAEQDLEAFKDISVEALSEIGRSFFLYFLHNEKEQKIRKLLTVEQFNDDELARVFTKQYVKNPLSYQELIFTFFIAKNAFIEASADIAALQFYAPIYFLLTICDRDPSQEEKALLTLEQHISQFSKLYRKN